MIRAPRLAPAFRRFVVHPIEAACAFALYLLFKLLPFEAASTVGGWLGRTVGPCLPLTERARRNLRRALPEKTEPEIAAIVRAMWDNLGRLAAEFPHLGEINVYDPAGPVTVSGAEWVDALRDDGRPGFFFSAHFGNWEILSLGATQRGLPVDRVYRAANNRLVEWLYRFGRAAAPGAQIPKGPGGVRQLLQSLHAGHHLGMMVDQKMNDGIPVPFFGRDAMTSTALVDLALRFDCPVVPTRVERVGGARFRLVIDPPLELVKTGERAADVAANTARINAIVEGWVRERPEQWLWLHNRWPD
ncbi:MAG: lipid A biosynthesis lauroyl acyltransferase [Rhodospirillales bacterium]|nr:lipid A biosynthesis lauroyl acyltransferase [Rhodospirillales bacterium]MSP80588.1 lipid A biosynthesis lauroyl acyltransferase [Rhodospirillales bacterium]